MIIIILVVLGLCFGSFVNALVWRIHEQENSSKPKKRLPKKDLSIIHGRSMCPNCHHTLEALELLPVISWLSLGGKCRYCKKPISWQYPLVELATAALFVISYLAWSDPLTGTALVIFGLWLVILVGFMALTVYDLRWMLLPNRIIWPMTAIALIYSLIATITSTNPGHALLLTIFAVLCSWGIFYLLYMVSDGRWIGGGDVKLGFIIGLLLGTPAKALLMLFIASLLGSLVALPLLAVGKAGRMTKLPFGPFLILATIIVQLVGVSVLAWYQRSVGLA